MSTIPGKRLDSYEERVRQANLDMLTKISALPPGKFRDADERTIRMRTMATLANFVRLAKETAGSNPELALQARRIEGHVSNIIRHIQADMP